MKRAQISLEYLVILALTIAVIIGAIYVFSDYVKDSGDEIIDARINTIGTRIVQQAESVHAAGSGTWIKVDVQFPNELSEVYTVDYSIAGRAASELVLVTNTTDGVSESVFFADINMTGWQVLGNKKSIGAISPGKATIKIESKGDYVLLNAS